MSALKICPQCGTEYELDQRFCPKDGSTLRLQDETGDLVGSIIADRYHVMRKLGEGGMGTVYLAEHVKMGRKSALKVMNPGMVKDADAISRFNREAANASRITHANVAAVYDFGETSEGLIYLAMEFVDGPPLTKLIEQLGALPPLRAADITRQAADALAVAHDMGIVHRDLKPDNIMVARNRDGSDCVKVVDFGIAKAADNAAQKVTKTGLVVGTPEYMSPEQLAGDKLDGRSDIYSLALVAFNMLTGRLPFPADTVQESMIMRLTDRPKELAEMLPGISWPGDVQAVLDRALQRDAGLRYQNASEFGRDLYRAVERMPASAAAEMGTQVIAPIPATRVAGAPPPAGGGATLVAGTPPTTAAPAVAAPAPTPAASPAVSPTASDGFAPPRRNRMPVVAAAAVILVAAGAGGFMLTKGGSAAGTDSGKVVPTGQPVTSSQQAGAANAPQTSGQTPPNPATGATSPGAGPGTRSTTRPIGATPPATQTATHAAPTSATPSVDDRLRSLEALTLDPDSAVSQANARKVISEINRLESATDNVEDQVHAAVLRSEALLVLDRKDDACSLLKRVEEKAAATTRAGRVRGLLRTC